jgi:hypothetical protein
MADVDMTDAPSASTAPVKKAVGKGKAGGAEGDGKKRFEVKKVRDRTPRKCYSNLKIVECGRLMGMGHRRRQLCYL